MNPAPNNASINYYNKDNMVLLNVLYIGNNEKLIGNAKRIGVTITQIKSISEATSAKDYNVILFENGFISKNDNTLILNLFNDGCNIYFNNFTSTKEISQLLLKEKSYEDKLNANENDRILIKLIKGKPNKYSLYNTSYDFQNEEVGTINLFKAVFDSIQIT